MAKSFSGKLSLTLDLTCEDADADLLAANLESLLEERVASFLDVTAFTVNVERFTS